MSGALSVTPNRLGRVGAAVDAWFTSPEPNAADRLGLFRILYSLFYLWHLSLHHAGRLAGMPPALHDPVLLTAPFAVEDLPTAFFETLESLLAGFLVLLMLGYRVRGATLGVLVLGGLLEAFYAGVKNEHATGFLTVFIPLFMLIRPSWGQAYSVDAALRRERSPVRRCKPSWHVFLPARCLLVLLAALFCSAGITKVLGTWLHQPGLVGNLLLERNVSAATMGLPINPLAPLIARMPVLEAGLRFGVPAFELLFPMILLGKRIRCFLLSLALVFHALNAIFLLVTFTPILVVYGLYVDWERLRRGLPWPARSGAVRLPQRLPHSLMTWGSVAAAGTAAAAWDTTRALRSTLNLGGLLDWHTIWYPLLPIALALCTHRMLGILAWQRSGRQP